jgi:hypothetical protein
MLGSIAEATNQIEQRADAAEQESEQEKRQSGDFALLGVLAHPDHDENQGDDETVCVYCGTPRWRYASRQDLCDKCGRFPPREAKPA